PVVALDPLTTGDTTPALSGTVDDPAATIVVTVDGIDYAATNNGDGTWSLADGTLPSLPEGEVTITVSATDPVGNVGTDSGIITIVDITPPTLLRAVTSVDGSALMLTYDEDIDAANLPGVGDFAVTVDGNPVAVTAINV